MNAHTRWLDRAEREQFGRTLNVSGAGSSLLQTQINKVIQMLTLRYLGVGSTLEIRPGSGNAAYINRRTAGLTGGAWVDDTDAATEETGTYAQVNFPYKTLLTQGTVTRGLQAKGKSYGDILGAELVGKSEDFSDQSEFGLISGDTGASGSAKQFNGLLTLINAVSTQVVATTNGTGGDNLVLGKLDAAIQRVKGLNSDKLIFVSQLGGRKINAALQAQQRFVNQTVIDGGFQVNTYNNIPIIESTRIPDTMAWSGTSITAFTGGGTTAVIIVNKRMTWIEELTPTTVMPLARTDSQFERFHIFRDFSLVYSNTLGGALLAGITTV